MTSGWRLSDWWSQTIHGKVVCIFFVISLMPMLAATELATRFVSETYRHSVEAWLNQSASFFVASVLDETRETARIADTLVEEGLLKDLVQKTSTQLPSAIRHTMDALGYDILAIFDDKDELVYSSDPSARLRTIPFSGHQSIYVYHEDGKTILMAAGKRTLTVEGRSYQVLLGTLIDGNFFSNMSVMQALTMRIFYKIDNTYEEVYSIHASDRAINVPSTVAKLQAAGPTIPYLSATHSGNRTISVKIPIWNDKDLLGFIYCGLSADAGVAGWLTRSNLFLGIFAIGMVLSIVSGSILTRLLTRPVKRLVEGVHAVARRDFSRRVEVDRQDELGQLAVAFNGMAEELDRLNKMEMRLRRRERFATLGEVAAGLAHEIRNPLGIIKTSAELIGSGGNLSAVEAKRLGYVVDEVRRIDKLIRDFLVFARPPQDLVPLRPADIVSRVLESCQGEIEARGVAATFTDLSDGAEINGDGELLTQACLNLVLNALQAMDGDEAEGTDDREKVLQVTLSADTEQLTLIFADSGPGIPEDLINRIFDPFFTTKGDGTGLGLARVYAVVEAHGGWIEVENQPMGGARFTLTLPRRTED